jgi:hypothetical protein
MADVKKNAENVQDLIDQSIDSTVENTQLLSLKERVLAQKKKGNTGKDFKILGRVSDLLGAKGIIYFNPLNLKRLDRSVQIECYPEDWKDGQEPTKILLGDYLSKELRGKRIHSGHLKGLEYGQNLLTNALYIVTPTVIGHFEEMENIEEEELKMEIFNIEELIVLG